VNDRSCDGTWTVIIDRCNRDTRILGVNLSRNRAHQFALSSGLPLCRGYRALFIDADLQDTPELLPQMMQLMDRGADVVYGQRKLRTGENAFKKSKATGFYRLLRCVFDHRSTQMTFG
jgi:polyisoprenyl-phosphate glycosyltransferase